MVDDLIRRPSRPVRAKPVRPGRRTLATRWVALEELAADLVDRGRWTRAWVVGVLGHLLAHALAVLVGGLAVGAAGDPGLVGGWLLLVGAPVVGALSGVLAHRPLTRPGRFDGVVVVAPVLVLTLVRALQVVAALAGEGPPSAVAVAVLVPCVVVLAVGLVGGVVAERRWSPPRTEEPAPTYA